MYFQVVLFNYLGEQFKLEDGHIIKHVSCFQSLAFGSKHIILSFIFSFEVTEKFRLPCLCKCYIK